MLKENEVPAEYLSLAKVLNAAFEQASGGKGKERHAVDGEPFEQQKICEIARRVGVGGPAFQVVKKIEESMRLPYPRNVAEVYGAINYAAACAILMAEEAAVIRNAHVNPPEFIMSGESAEKEEFPSEEDRERIMDKMNRFTTERCSEMTKLEKKIPSLKEIEEWVESRRQGQKKDF